MSLKVLVVGGAGYIGSHVCKALAERGVEIFFTQVFRDSFFHADMHPGNIFVSRQAPSDPQYIAIDCGIVGSLTREDQDYLARNQHHTKEQQEAERKMLISANGMRTQREHLQGELMRLAEQQSQLELELQAQRQRAALAEREAQQAIEEAQLVGANELASS